MAIAQGLGGPIFVADAGSHTLRCVSGAAGAVGAAAAGAVLPRVVTVVTVAGAADTAGHRDGTQ